MNNLFCHILSNQGSKSPQNEDSYAIPEVNEKFKIESLDTKGKGFLYVVCDGMGGANAGEVASELASHWLIKHYYESSDINELQLWFESQIKKINEDLYKLSKEHEEYTGMGTTLVSLLIKGNVAYIANIGDSRLYLLDIDNNSFEQITEDHSEVWELYKQGHISKDDIIHNNRKHILTQALGTEKNISVNTYQIKLPKQYLFLLCSDGLTDVATDGMILHTLSHAESLKSASDALYKLSQDNHSKDDVTILLVSNVSDKEFTNVVKNSYKKMPDMRKEDEKKDTGNDIKAESEVEIPIRKSHFRKNIFFSLIVVIIIFAGAYALYRSSMEKNLQDEEGAVIESNIVDTIFTKSDSNLNTLTVVADSTLIDSVDKDSLFITDTMKIESEKIIPSNDSLIINSEIEGDSL